MKNNVQIVFLLSILMAGASNAETVAEKDARLAWWREARFGLFIHWGLYAVPAGEWKGLEKEKNLHAEWIMYHARIPVAEYEPLATQFNPGEFDADEWVHIAQQAGMKYMVITAKHCDGFAMYHSKVTPYNIVDGTPFARDPMEELSAASSRAGIKLGFYYSHSWDWHEADAPGYVNNWDFPPKEKRNPDLYYTRKSLPQVKELAINYKPALFWLDVPDLSREMSQRFLDIIRQNLPDCIVNNRIGNGLGDYDTPELFIPRKKIGKAWTRQPGSYDDFEVAMTLNEHWGFDKNDHKWKDARTVVRHLAEAVSRGGNYLLNVGPTAAGAFPPEAKRILGKVGAWMKENGESIHGASAGPFSILPWGVCTAKPGRLYLHVFDRPVDGRLLVPGLGNELRRAYQLAGGNQAVLNAQRFGRDDWIVQLPAKATDPLHPVVVLEIEGLPQVDPSIVVYPPLAMLPASTARIDGSKIKYAPLYMTNRHHDYISEWTEISDFVEWQVRIAQEGVYNVEAVIGADVACEGNQFTLEVGDGKLEGLVASTGGYKNFQTVKLGTIGIPARGPCTLTVKPVMIKPGTSLMNLHALILKPSGAQSVEM